MRFLEISIILVYLVTMISFAVRGLRRTQTSTDYMLAGRKAHPFVMALSYGAAFISTSAIVGFGGQAARLGMGLLWLVFLNIFVGIFIAFLLLGGPTRRIGSRLGAKTFPEFLGRRFQSRFVQVFAGLIIFIFMPLYTTAVLLGGAEFMQTQFRIHHFLVTVIILALVVAAYVTTGGLKGVMYNDAMQGTIMLIGMAILVIITYMKLGGIHAAHESLAALAPHVPSDLQGIGHRGWTRMPRFGWGGSDYTLWWQMVSTITIGVGIGVLAQPQLAVRFMTVKAKRELNRAVGVGAFFILMLPGVAYTVGALSNVYFHDKEELRGRIVEIAEDGQSMQFLPERSAAGARAQTIPLGPSSEIVRGEGDEPDIVRPRLIALRRAGSVDKVIPTYIEQAMPRWFGLIFFLTLLSAAITTISSLFLTMGTAIGRDVFGQVFPRLQKSDRSSIMVMRIGICAGLLVSIILAAAPLRGYIAIATALFFGICGAAFLPTFLGALFWKRMTRAGAIVSMVGGFAISMTWMLFFFGRTAGAIGLCRALTGRNVLLTSGNWADVDPMVVALPLSILLAVVASLLSGPPAADHLEACFGKK